MRTPGAPRAGSRSWRYGLKRSPSGPTGRGGPEVGARELEAHHAAPRCLLGLHDRANGLPLNGEGIQAWLEWEWEATRWRVPIDISGADLEELVERSAEQLERE